MTIIIFADHGGGRGAFAATASSPSSAARVKAAKDAMDVVLKRDMEQKEVDA